MNGEQAFGTTQRARCAMARGEHADGTALFEEAREVHTASRETVQLLIVEGMLAECLLLGGDAQAALDLILDVEDAQRRRRRGPALPQADPVARRDRRSGGVRRGCGCSAPRSPTPGRSSMSTTSGGAWQHWSGWEPARTG